MLIMTLTAVAAARCSPPDPSPVEAASQITNVFGEDDREVVDATSYPYSAIGRLDSGCTGALISPTLVLTAAHCVIQSSTGRLRPDLGSFRPAYGPGNRNLKAWISEFWIGSHHPEDQRWLDFAILKLAAPLPAFGSMLVSSLPLEGAFPAPVRLAGYSADEQGGEVLSVHRTCTVREKDDKGRLLHDCDATAGISGAPLFRHDPRLGQAVILGLAVSEFRQGANASVFRDAYSADYANVGISTASFLDVARQLLAMGPALPAGLRIRGAFHMANTNAAPQEHTQPAASPAVSPAGEVSPLTTCPNVTFAINAAVLTGEILQMEGSACTVARQAPHLVTVATGIPHPALYDHASALSSSSVYLCSILNTFRMGGMDHVTASQQLAPHLCGALKGMVGIHQYVAAHQAELLALEPGVNHLVSQTVVNTQNLGRLVLRMH
jgi:V8-like Glu-specific endopeptidase